MAAGLLASPARDAEGAGMAVGPDPSFAVLHGLYWLCANLAARASDLPRGGRCPLGRFRVASLPGLHAAAARGSADRADRRHPPARVGRRRRAARHAHHRPVGRDRPPRAADPRRGRGVRRGRARRGARPGSSSTPAVRATRGTPFLLRELVGALREDMVAPTAAAAAHVRADRRPHASGGRSCFGSTGCPRPRPGWLERVAILERGDLGQAARLAELDEDEAATAADVLAAADIVEPGRPLTFVHPIVRTGIYARAHTGPAGSRAPCCGAAAGGAAGDERARGRAPARQRAGSRRVGGRAARGGGDAAARSGAPESAAVYLRRALEEPPDPASRPGLLLALGMAEASAGLRHLAGPPGGGACERHRRLLARGRRDGAGARARSRPQVGRRRRGARSRGVAARPGPRGARGCGSRPRRSAWG